MYTSCGFFSVEDSNGEPLTKTFKSYCYVAYKEVGWIERYDVRLYDLFLEANKYLNGVSGEYTVEIACDDYNMYHYRKYKYKDGDFRCTVMEDDKSIYNDDDDEY